MVETVVTEEAVVTTIHIVTATHNPSSHMRSSRGTGKTCHHSSNRLDQRPLVVMPVLLTHTPHGAATRTT